MIFVFYFFAAVSVFIGWKSLRGGIEYLEFFRREIEKPQSAFKPFASIIAPCRGLDEGLEANLTALLRQNFPRCEIIFVVGDERDEAAAIIKKLIAREESETRKRHLQNLSGENSPSAKLIVAGRAENESQKIHNLRRAVLEVSAKSEVFVFVDSDARPDENWLSSLVAPLADGRAGAATGYRWFVPKRGNLASHLRSVWNASIASALGRDEKNNFCWGGATAIRRATFEKLDIAENWRGALSDDFIITRVLREKGLPVRFVPQCLTATVEDCGWRELFEFTTRQMKITRVYAAHLWRASFLGSALFTLAFWLGALNLFFASAGWRLWLALAFLTVIYALGAAKAILRLNAARLALKDYAGELNRSFFPHALLWTLAPVLFFCNDFAALFSNEITWRGIRYKLKSPRETVIISDDKI